MSSVLSTRRRSIRAFYQNGACWGLGNGLVSSSLIVYLAGEYRAAGLAVSLILATPRLVGVLRLGAPIWIEAVGDRQKFSVRMFLAAAIVLMLLPIVSAPGALSTPRFSLAALITLWTLYHLLEFLGLVALWAWIGEVVPNRIRGRFIGRRAQLLNALQVAGMVAGGGASWWWRDRCEQLGQNGSIWLGYAGCAMVGAMFFCLAVWPLALEKGSGVFSRTRNSSRKDSRPLLRRWSKIFAPFFDRDNRRFLVYGGWFSLANGITSSAAFLFQMRVLDITYAGRLALDGTSQAAQAMVMPYSGRAIDRWSGVPVLVAAQVLVALGLVFFLVATPAQWWWIIGAYALWVAYAGINTAMPKLMLSLSRREQYAAYAAAWFAWTELVYALSTLAGGLLFDWAGKHFTSQEWAGWRVDHYAAIFLLGLVLRLSAAGWAMRIREPRSASPTGDGRTF